VTIPAVGTLAVDSWFFASHNRRRRGVALSKNRNSPFAFGDIP